MSVKEKYIAALNDEQAKMVSYVKQMTAKVAFPETAVTTTYVKPAKHTIVSAACLIGGAITIAAGLCLEKNGISTAGGVAVACGAGLWAIDRIKSLLYSVMLLFIRSQVITISLFLISLSM